VLGSPQGHRAFAARLSAGAAVRVILPGYRLAPEHGPAEPVQDAVTAYRALVAEGTSPAHVVISGDSAGGGLALAALIALRDAGEPMPAGCVALSPWTDATLSAASIAANAERDVFISPAFLSTLALMRFGPDGDREDPLASPAFASWAGIPPLLLFASSTETLRDDSVTVFEKARAAGVNAQLEIYEDMVHVWPFFSEWLPEGRRAIDQIAAFVHACTSPPVNAL
jgi:acetyl esterase/lipase